MAFTHLNGTQIYYEVCGQGQPLLMITGYGSDHLAWANVLPALSQHFQVILIDNRDSGLSQRMGDNYSIADMAADAVSVLDALQIERAHVIGHSMGGAIAQQLALDFPERLDKLMLYATSAKFDARCCYWIEQTLTGIMSENAAIRAVSLPSCVSPKFLADPKKIEQFIRMAAETPNPVDIAGLKRQFNAVIHHDTCDELKNIQAQTLVIACEYDVLTPPRDGQDLADHLPNARYHEIAEYAHCFHWEEPALFCRLVGEFFGGSK